MVLHRDAYLAPEWKAEPHLVGGESWGRLAGLADIAEVKENGMRKIAHAAFRSLTYCLLVICCSTMHSGLMAQTWKPPARLLPVYPGGVRFSLPIP